MTRTEGNLCYGRHNGEEGILFIWAFRDGLNAMHDWPTKGEGPVCFCPGIYRPNPHLVEGR